MSLFFTTLAASLVPGDTETCHWGTTRDVAKFGVAGDVPDDDNVVIKCHVSLRWLTGFCRYDLSEETAACGLLLGKSKDLVADDFTAVR